MISLDLMKSSEVRKAGDQSKYVFSRSELGRQKVNINLLLPIKSSSETSFVSNHSKFQVRYPSKNAFSIDIN